ncbi:cuticle protein 70, isoforms A and B-like [Musca vetustissima]|uniref:cuticle protein 70, isoforms A and B-like n=1 Tax=Musca vetustissima TaxID=27455 RepID=UPI002AB7B979|nr:cuticle protein 70, isoforms A and B-like [Musca vetustissima]
MFKFAIVLFAIIACAAAKPGLVTPLAYTAPAAVVAAAPAPFVTATSSQYVARNYNGIATAPVVAPVATPVVAKTVAAPIVAKTFAAPVAAAYTTPVVAKYAATYAAPFAYSAPLTYAAAPAPVFF